MIVRNVGSFQVERTRYASGCRRLERCLGQLGTSKRQVEVADAFERGGWHLRGLRQISVARDPDE